uniref:Uncharacterized protein n=1 Tax=Anguilla anguilla TaxID=7936 RepID=A0A0E9QDM9_ANGAN
MEFSPFSRNVCLSPF